MNVQLARRLFAVPRPVWSLRFRLSLLGYAVALLVWLVLSRYGGLPVDADDFFVNPAQPYADRTFVYSPVAADAFGLLRRMDFPAFVAVIRAAELTALSWFAGPALPFAILLPPVAAEVNAANVNLVLMTCVVLGFRWPALWSVVLVTKPTMGLGLLWFAYRRDWRKLGIAVGATAGIVLLSLALQPGTWVEYARAVMDTTKSGGWPFPWPVWERAIVFVPLALWACRSERRWALVAAVILAAPRFYFLSPVMLVALWRTDLGREVTALVRAAGDSVGASRRAAGSFARVLRSRWPLVSH